MSGIAANVIAYFRWPFSRGAGFSLYGSPRLRAHLPLLLAFAMTGLFLHAPGISPWIVIWVIAGIYLGRDIALLCDSVPGAFLACWCLCGVVLFQALVISNFCIAHPMVPGAATSTVALLVITRAALASVSVSRAQRAMSKAAGMQTAPSQPPHFSVFAANGNCARCGFNRLNGNEWRDEVSQQVAPGVCTIRGFDIEAPLTTYCKNHDSRDSTALGTVYAISRDHGNLALPWVEVAMPRTALTTCCICGAHNERGIAVSLPDGNAECCSPEHYLAWWSDFLFRRLAYFKVLGERAYSDMYDVVGRSATGFYSDAKEAFHSAIATARDLELAAEQEALEQRLAHIKDVFRNQFK